MNLQKSNCQEVTVGILPELLVKKTWDERDKAVFCSAVEVGCKNGSVEVHNFTFN